MSCPSARLSAFEEGLYSENLITLCMAWRCPTNTRLTTFHRVTLFKSRVKHLFKQGGHFAVLGSYKWSYPDSKYLTEKTQICLIHIAWQTTPRSVLTWLHSETSRSAWWPHPSAHCNTAVVQELQATEERQQSHMASVIKLRIPPHIFKRPISIFQLRDKIWTQDVPSAKKLH
jgi:hypothetical protein